MKLFNLSPVTIYKLILVSLMSLFLSTAWAEGNPHADRWNPIHFKPAIDKASNEECLSCHADVLTNKVLEKSPSGVKANKSLAWYQTLDTYEGEQQTFHQRHLTSKMATELMDLKCSTCHQGHDPGTEISYLVQSGEVKPILGKLVDPDVCLLCHGELDVKTMAGLAGPWPEVRDTYNNDCMVCHNIFRTKRHEVNYLKAEAIEKSAENKGDSCYGCHGGRAWYRVGYPYARTPWPGMALEIPEWAKGRPDQSEARFLVGVKKTSTQEKKAEASETEVTDEETTSNEEENKGEDKP